MSKIIYFSLLLLFLLTQSAAAQISCEQIEKKKDDILLKSNKNTSTFIDELTHANDRTMQKFTMKRLHLTIIGKDLKHFDFWEKKAEQVRERTEQVTHILLEELNTILQLAENSEENYVNRPGHERRASSLQPIDHLKNGDDRTIPTKQLIGGNVNHPQPVQTNLEEELRKYRNDVLAIAATYKENDQSYLYDPSKTFTENELIAPIDEFSLRKIHDFLPLEEVTYRVNEEGTKRKTVSWLVDNFYFSSVLETAVMINQLVLTVKMVEQTALELFYHKIDAPHFNYNKIASFPVLADQSLTGDITLQFIIAAIDSSASFEYRYTFDNSLPKEKWITGENEIIIQAEKVKNNQVIYGESKIMEKGRPKWISWEYKLP